ncbi:MAG: VanZ family protein [Flavobacteriales bacterium]
MPFHPFERDQFWKLLPLVVWCSVIFAFSEMPGSGLDIVPSVWYILERKSAHVFEYAVLTFLSYRFFVAVYPRETFARVAALVLCFGLAYGALDEFHQSFVFGRGARFTDVLVDGLGTVLALMLISLLQKRVGK